MKTTSFLIVIALLSILLSACATVSETTPPLPLPTNPSTPTLAPEPVFLPDDIVYLSDNNVAFFQVTPEVPGDMVSAMLAYIYDGEWIEQDTNDVLSVAWYGSGCDQKIYQVVHRYVDGEHQVMIEFWNGDGSRIGTFRAFRWVDGNLIETPAWDPGV